MKKTYFTTPIYYINDLPHIGHAYTTIVADVLNRFQKLLGRESYFLTGTDEHGQKVEASAKLRGKDPLDHCNEMSENYKNIWKELDVKPDIFMRTTFEYHKRAVQDCLMQLWESGDIYSADYEGWYCVSEEIFYTEKDLVNGKTASGKEVQKIKEKNYFFKMSKYRQTLIDYIQNTPGFIAPDFRKNEVLGFLKQDLSDLNISRPKSRLSWGIELPFDKDFVTYVWFDALLNYATAIGLKQAGREKEFEKWWPHSVHLLGKDILITHTVYWTTMLFALKLPQPQKIFAHGWWLTENNEKMSKSQGPVAKPLDVKNLVGVDGLRYFLARDIHLGNDAQFSVDLVVNRVNSELANNLGNLLSRSTNLVVKYFDGSIPDYTESLPETKELKKLALATPALIEASLDKLELNMALGHVIDLLTFANKYMENLAPWKTAKTDLALTAECLRATLEVLRFSGIAFSAVMPAKSKLLLDAIGWASEPKFSDMNRFEALETGKKIAKAEPLFPRIETV
jgi:methionyl-tRNA synthetase